MGKEIVLFVTPENKEHCRSRVVISWFIYRNDIKSESDKTVIALIDADTFLIVHVYIFVVHSVQRKCHKFV